MASATLLSLRGRMTPPRARRPVRTPEVDRLLHLAADLFGVAVAAVVLVGDEGPVVEAASAIDRQGAASALDAARRLFELLAASPAPVSAGSAAGVMEEIVQGRGFLAATPILVASGRCIGALCLVDPQRRMLLTRLQRRLFGEFGDLVAPALNGSIDRPRPDPSTPEARAGEPAANDPDLLQALADRDADAVALFDTDGRCLLRNRRFDTLLGTASAAGVAPVAIPAARGCEAHWLARHIARDVPPVGVYRASLPDGTWLSVEERRGPQGRSLVARVEERDSFGGDGDMQLLFERCPFPMFVFDRDSRAILAVNAAALTLYGWDRDAFLRLDLDGLGAVGTTPRDAADAAEAWTHRTRDGRVLPVSGRSIGVDHRGRPAVLVTVTAGGGFAA